MQIVAVDDEVTGQVGRTDAFFRVRKQRPVGHAEVMVVDVFLTLEDDFRHGVALWFEIEPRVYPARRAFHM